MLHSYPKYPATWFGGQLPGIKEMPGPPPDQTPTDNINPHYTAYAATHGRTLAGVGRTQTLRARCRKLYGTRGLGADEEPPMDPLIVRNSDEEKPYPNELEVLSELDDVQSNGIFDAPGTHGNVHPDAGIFADRQALPGYVAREQWYQPSEVIDATTGRPVMYVPAGSPALNPREMDALRETARYAQTILQDTEPRPSTPQQPNVDPITPVFQVGATEEEKSGLGTGLGTTLAIGAALGLGLGLAAAALSRPKRRRS